jgi:hypothetical protein
MSDLRNYPEGRGANVVRYIRDVEVAFGVIKTFRQRFTVAQLTTAGLAFTSCPALPGVRWRMCDLIMIAIGGNVTTSTSINVAGTVAGSAVELAVVAAARLTRSLINRMGTPFATAGAESITSLADGASFTQMDANTALVAHSVGGTPTVATAVDMLIDYVADPA